MADYATQYLTPEDEYPVVQITRTVGDFLDESLPYKLYDGQLFFINKNKKLFIGNNSTVETIADYPYFQAGDWKSITGSIAERGTTGYKLRTDAVINALPFVNTTTNDTGNVSYQLNCDSVIVYNRLQCFGTLYGTTVRGSLASSAQYTLDGNETFKIWREGDDNYATIQLGNKDMIKFADDRFIWCGDMSDGYDSVAKKMDLDEYVLFPARGERDDFYTRMTMGIFVTWTYYRIGPDTSSNNTYQGVYTHFIPKTMLSTLRYIYNEGTDEYINLTHIRYYKDGISHETYGIPVSSGLMIPPGDLNRRVWGLKTLFLTPIGLFGHSDNIKNINLIDISPTEKISVNNNNWILKYVTII